MTASLASANGVTYSTYTYHYNTDGTLAGVIHMGSDPSPYTSSFTYNGKFIYRKDDAGINTSFDTITLNDAGMIAVEKTQTGPSTLISNLSYDVNGLLSTFTVQQNTYPSTTATYTFTNGDMTLAESAGYPSDTLVYEINKPAVMGNRDDFYQLLTLGAMYIKNKHLLVEEHHGSTRVFTYTYTPEGNISSIKVATLGNGFYTINYTYSCQ